MCVRFDLSMNYLFTHRPTFSSACEKHAVRFFWRKNLLRFGVLGDLCQFCCTTMCVRFDLSMNYLFTHRPTFSSACANFAVRFFSAVEVFEAGVFGDLGEYCCTT
ncbi:hypothetical protein Droror1_Dr00014548 [Drosera rotundifolia]